MQEAGEPGLAGVTVTLYDSQADTVVKVNATGESISGITTTDENGAYIFENLPPGDYYVVFDVSTAEDGDQYVITQTDQGDDATDSDADRETGASGETGFLNSGEEDMSLDAGFYLPVAVGDTVWEDLNANGIQDPGEPGVGGVEVVIYNDENEEIARAVTDENGHYLFEGLNPDEYYIIFNLESLPENYLLTKMDQGDDTKDSDPDKNTGRTPGTGFLSSGEKDLSLDMGIYQTASLGDFCLGRPESE